jgi:polysaccharide export outer membrane protein
VKYVIQIVVLTVFVVSMAMHVAWAEEYRLGPGDILTFGVWGYEDLQVNELVIRPDGKVNFPIVGEINVMGTSIGQLTELLTEGLSHYINNPKVTVNIIKFRTTRVYVLGEVAKPGLYELEKQHNLLDALGIAGSYTRNAAKKKVYIIRKDQTSSPVKVNLMNIWEKGDMTQNYALGDGDVVYLSDSGRINFATDILPLITGGYYMTHM